MSLAPWRVEVASTSKASPWYTLPSAHRAQIEEELRREPFYDDSKPQCRRHLKAKIFDKDCYCHREYRDLENGYRIFYKPDKRQRVILIWYVGPHPQQKARRGSGRH